MSETRLDTVKSHMNKRLCVVEMLTNAISSNIDATSIEKDNANIVTGFGGNSQDRLMYL